MKMWRQSFILAFFANDDVHAIIPLTKEKEIISIKWKENMKGQFSRFKISFGNNYINQENIFLSATCFLLASV